MVVLITLPPSLHGRLVAGFKMSNRFAGSLTSGHARRLGVIVATSMACLTLACSLKVAAADIAPQVTDVPVTATNWNGFYFGAHAGLMGSSAQYDYSTLLNGSLNNHTRIGRINGAAPGIFGGYNYQMGSFVVGLEGDATFTNGRFRLNGPNFDFLQYSNVAFTIGGRGGYLVTPATLAYAKLGYTTTELVGIQNFGDKLSRYVGATQVGVGLEQLITDDVAARLEASYTAGQEKLVINNGLDSYRPSFLKVVAGISYKIDPLPHPHQPHIDLVNETITHAPSWTSVWAGGDFGININQLNRYDATFGEMGPYGDLRFTGGALAGGDVQLSRYLVVGAAIDTQFTNSGFDDDVGVGLGAVFHRFAHIDRVSAVTGRLGVLLSPTFLLYGKGGPAQIRFVPDQTYFAAINPSVVTSAHNLPSVQGGLGIETMVSDHLALRIEGLYTRATHSVVIDGILPSQTTVQPTALTGTVALVVKY